MGLCFLVEGTAAPPVSAKSGETMIGRIADYELLEKIGEGGMGVVFRGRNPRLGSIVAVKVLLHELARDPEYRARFLREARAEASLHHSSIAACFDVGEGAPDPPDLLQPGSPGPHPERLLYLIMEYVPGTDLHELVRDRPIEIPRVLDLGIQIAAGLEAAHKAGVIHRDLKSTNIRVMPDGQVKIVDFGLSRTERPGSSSETTSLATSQGRVLGTVQFMAPEQARGRTIDPRSDLFSLGVILYQLVTGRLPFTGETQYEVANAVASVEPPPLARYASQVPDELERVVRKLIAKDPEQRYQSAHEVRTDLERLRHGRAGREPGSRPAARFRRTWVVASGTALLVVGLAVLADLLWPRPTLGLAVMPFENRTGDPRLDYLGDGMAANAIADLVRGARFNVASLSSAKGLDPGQRSAAAVARGLGVQAVVEGSLRRDGGITVLDVQLVDGRRGFVLWSDRFPYALKDAAEIEREAVRQVTKRLGGRWTSWGPADRTVATRSPSAYDLYLRAGALLEDPDDPRGPDQALEHYARALEVDPDFALAWAGESRALFKIWDRDKTQESLRRAEEAANRAIHINPELLEARLARAQILRATSRHAESIRELQEVLRVNPNWDEALIHLAASYREAGDLVRAQATARRAIAQRPGYWRNWDQLGALLFRGAKYPEAGAAFGEVIRLLPEKNRGYEQLAAVEMKQGDFAAALAAYDRLPSPVTSGLLASNVGSAFFFERRLDDARRYYGLAIHLEPRNHRWWWALGDLHLREGKRDSAQAEYTRAVSLIEDVLHVDPINVKLRLDRALCLAKLGQCDAGQAALAEVAGRLPPGDADCALHVAMVMALCRHPAEAIGAIRRAVDLGASPEFLQKQDEFLSLAGDARFQALTRVKKS